jgi:hypothetical protein
MRAAFSCIGSLTTRKSPEARGMEGLGGKLGGNRARRCYTVSGQKLAMFGYETYFHHRD